MTTVEGWRRRLARLGIPHIKSGPLFWASERQGQYWLAGKTPVPEAVVFVADCMLALEVDKPEAVLKWIKDNKP